MKKVRDTQSLLFRFIDLDMISHIICASLIRLCLVFYGIWHDQSSDVQYTDVDYKVFTDAARHVVNGNSPYDRGTFRYSPLIAYLLTPNIYFHPAFGKIIFCEVDLMVGYFIKQLVYYNILECLSFKKAKLKISGDVTKADYWAHRAMLFWLYNPMTLAISTRGNSDSLACLLVILTLYFLQTKVCPLKVGLLHGLSVHFRLYPVIYSLTFFMYLSRFSYYLTVKCGSSQNAGKKIKSKHKKSVKKRTNKIEERERSMFRKDHILYFVPNVDQIMFVLGMMLSSSALTSVFYWLYGYKFLYESFIYHLVRIDFRHNFSLYFYLQYLSAWIKFEFWTISIWQSILISLPPLILMIYFSIYFGLNRYSLNFAVLTQTIVFVIYNKVLTSQYFVWIMAILPLCIWQIRLSFKTILIFCFIWFVAQGAWLLPAYLLEFQGENTFLYIWIQGVSLFCAHVGILGRLVKNFIIIMHEIKRTD